MATTRRRIKNENQDKKTQPKKAPISSDLPEKTTKIKVGEITVFIKFTEGGESLETLLEKHFKGMNNAQK